MMSLCDCWKEFCRQQERADEKQNILQFGYHSSLSSQSTSKTAMVIFDQNGDVNQRQNSEAATTKFSVTLYRSVSRSQSPLMTILYNMLSPPIDTLVADFDWYDVWDRCDRFNKELFVADKQSGRTPLHLAFLFPSTVQTDFGTKIRQNRNDIQSSGRSLVIVGDPMWEQAIDLMVEINPHALITVDKYNCTPLHLVSNLHHVVQETSFFRQEATFSLIKSICQKVTTIPSRYLVDIDALAIVSTSHKPSTQSLYPPPPLLMACRKNASAETIYWIFQTQKEPRLLWIAPFTGGETVRDVMEQRYWHRESNEAEMLDKLDWRLRTLHESPLEAVLNLLTDNGKTIESMIQLVQTSAAEKLFWKVVAEQISKCLGESSEQELFSILHSFLSSEPPVVCASHSSTTKHDHDQIQDEMSIIELRHRWVKCILLLLLKPPNSLQCSKSLSIHGETRTTKITVRSIEKLVLTVSCLDRPIPAFLQLVSIIFPEQLLLCSPVPFLIETKCIGDSNHHHLLPLHQILLLMPMMMNSVDNDMENGCTVNEKLSCATTSDAIFHSSLPCSVISATQGSIESDHGDPKRKPINAARRNLYMHTQFDFTSASTRSNTITDRSPNFALPNNNNGEGYPDAIRGRDQLSRIMEKQIRIVVDIQPYALRIPITTTNEISSQYFGPSSMNKQFTPDKYSDRFDSLDQTRDVAVYYPFVLAAIQNCSLDTIFRMIGSDPHVVELQRRS